MDQLIYCFTIEETVIKLVINSLGFCVYIINNSHTHVVIHDNLDESLAIMQYLMNLFS